MNNQVGLGPTGTHILHGGVVAGGTWAIGRYAGVEALQAWWAPLVGGLVGMGLSVVVDFLLTNDDVSYEVFEAEVIRQIKNNPDWTRKQGRFDSEGRFEKAIAPEIEKLLADAKDMSDKDKKSKKAA